MKFDYKNMKMGKHGIPAFDAFAYPVLDLMSDGEARRKNDVKKLIADSVGLPNDLRILRYEKTQNTIIVEDRVSFAIQYLYMADALTRSGGVYQITDEGRNLLHKYGPTLNGKILRSQSAFVNYKANSANSDANQDSTEFDEESPEDMLETFQSYVDKFNDEAASELLKNILNMDSVFFEKLVVQLLVEMGYSDHGGSARVTQQSSDGGIDGIINRDPLGTSTVYIQAKRYQVSSKVQRPEIQKFNGALNEHGADRGVFITISDFSSGALESTKALNIIPINGARLAELMMKYRVGVKSRKVYELLEVDTDFFE